MSAKKGRTIRTRVQNWTVAFAASGTELRMRFVREPRKLNPPMNLSPHRRAFLGWLEERIHVTSQGDTMSFFIAAILGAFSGVLYLADRGQAFTPVCRYTFDLCQHPSWPLYVAGMFVAFGFLFQLQKS
jgi:hypothetical protein